MPDNVGPVSSASRDRSGGSGLLSSTLSQGAYPVVFDKSTCGVTPHLFRFQGGAKLILARSPEKVHLL